MQTASKPFTFEEARQRAEATARDKLQYFMTDPDMPPLREDYMEAEHCWIFFRNPDIKLPDPSTVNGLLPYWAYCYSKRGEGRLISDLSDDPAACREYLQKMSDYFKEKGL